MWNIYRGRDQSRLDQTFQVVGIDIVPEFCNQSWDDHSWYSNESTTGNIGNGMHQEKRNERLTRKPWSIILGFLSRRILYHTMDCMTENLIHL